MRHSFPVLTVLILIGLLFTGCESVTAPEVDDTATLNATASQDAAQATATGNTTVVTPDDTSWYFSSDHYNEDGDLETETLGTGGITEVPVEGDWGAYGFELTIPDGETAKARAMTDLYNGIPLADLEEVTYSTYIESAWSEGYGPSINVMIDPANDVDGEPDDFVTLVWEANKAGHTIEEDTWQDWSTTGGTGGWWSPSIRPFSSPTPGSNANPAQLDAFVDLYGADSEIIGFAVNVGRHPEMTSYVDGVGVTADGVTRTYDFEAFRVATSKDECKKGGWQDVRRADGSAFRNQGECIRYVNTGR